MSELPVKEGCNFCRSNLLLKDRVAFTSPGAYVIEPNTQAGLYLIIPEGHYESLQELDDDWWKDIKTILDQLPELDEFNLSINLGEHAGQRLKHLHFWVIPRQAGQPASGKGTAALIDAVNESQKTA